MRIWLRIHDEISKEVLVEVLDRIPYFDHIKPLLGESLNHVQ